jgi:cytochrome b561
VSTSNKKSQYNVAKVMHWIVAFIAVLLLMSGWRAEELAPDSRLWFMMIHSGLGSLVFALMLFRWWWRRNHKLYSPRQWYKKPSMLLQWFFYPLLLIHPLIGVTQAAFNSYDVSAFGLVNFSALAAENEALFAIFHKMHTITALLLIFILFIHIADKSRRFFVEDSNEHL